jgi:hypothetical protein
MQKIIFEYFRLVKSGITFSIPVALATYILIHCDYVISDLLIYTLVFLLFAGPVYVILNKKFLSQK